MATHGSLTKAGKVRGQTPKVEGVQKEDDVTRIHFIDVQSKNYKTKWL